MTIAIDTLAAKRSTIDIALGVVEHQTAEKGKFSRKEYALYSFLMKQREEIDNKIEELKQHTIGARVKKLFKK